MNAQLNASLSNRWLASTVSFGLITWPDHRVLYLCVRDFSNAAAECSRPCFHALVGAFGGLVGAVQVYAGLTLVNKVGAGPFVGFTVTAALIASLVVDHFGLFHMPVHAINAWRILGGLLMIGGIALIARF